MKKQLLFIIFLISIISFSCTKQQKIEESKAILKSLGNKINTDLTNLRQDIEELTNNLSYKIPYYSDFDFDFNQKFYSDNHKNLINCNSKANSAIFLSNDVILSDSLKKFIANSEAFDSLFKQVLEKNILISQIYFLKKNSFLRIFPYIDIEKHIAGNFDLLNTITYKLSSDKPFIEHHAYWLDKPFADPFGRGWVLSCSEPVYYRNNYQGIVCGDISINELKLNYLSSNNDIIILVNRNLELIAATKEGEKFLNIPAYREFQYYKPILENINLYSHAFVKEHNSEGFKKALGEMQSGKMQSNFYLNNTKYTLISEQINETGWYILQIVN